MSSNGARASLKEHGHIVIVGASLAGLRAAETLRNEGFTGPLTLIGDEPYLPYDRPPLSKAVLTGWIPADHTQLPRRRTLADVKWQLGVPATGLDLSARQVRLADGRAIEYDRLLIATGTRARPWPNQAEAALDGVFTLRGRDDAQKLRQRLAAKPQRVLVIGGGFTGSEIASDCRELGLPVTVAERGAAPLVGALGGVIATRAAALQRQHGRSVRDHASEVNCKRTQFPCHEADSRHKRQRERVHPRRSQSTWMGFNWIPRRESAWPRNAQ